MSSARLSWNDSTIDVLPAASTSDTNAYIKLGPTTPAINVGETVIINGSENKISLNEGIIMDGNNTKIEVGSLITIDGSATDSITLKHPSDSNKSIEINAAAGTLTAKNNTNYVRIGAAGTTNNVYIRVDRDGSRTEISGGIITISNPSTETAAAINRIDDDYLRNPTEDGAKQAVPSTYAVYRAIQESISSDYYPFELIPNIDDPSKPTFTIRFNNIFGDSFKVNTLSQDFVITYGADRYTNFVDNEGQIVRTTMTMIDWKTEVNEKMSNNQTSFEYKCVDFTDYDTTELEYASGSDYSFKFIGCTFEAASLQSMFGLTGPTYEPDELSVKFIGCTFADNSNAENMFGNLHYTKRLTVTGLDWSKIANAKYMFANLNVELNDPPCQITLDGDMNMSSITSLASISYMFANMCVAELDLSTLHFTNITYPQGDERNALLFGNTIYTGDGTQTNPLERRVKLILNNTYWNHAFSATDIDHRFYFDIKNADFDSSTFLLHSQYIIEAVELNGDIVTLTLRQGWTDSYDTGISNYELDVANVGADYLKDNDGRGVTVAIKGLRIDMDSSIKIKSIKIKYYSNSESTTQTEETFSGTNEFMTEAELASIETEFAAYIYRDTALQNLKRIDVTATTNTESYPFNELAVRTLVYCNVY